MVVDEVEYQRILTEVLELQRRNNFLQEENLKNSHLLKEKYQRRNVEKFILILDSLQNNDLDWISKMFDEALSFGFRWSLITERKDKKIRFVFSRRKENNQFKHIGVMYNNLLNLRRGLL